MWLTGGTLAAILLGIGAFLAVVLFHGLAVFWPGPLAFVELSDGTRSLGQCLESDVNPDTKAESLQFKTGNRELDPSRLDFHWFKKDSIRQISYPQDALVLERKENGDCFGFFRELNTPSLDVPPQGEPRERFLAAFEAARHKQATQIGPMMSHLSNLSARLQTLREEIVRVEYRQRGAAADEYQALATQLSELQLSEQRLKQESDELVARQQQAEQTLRANVVVLETAGGQSIIVPLIEVVRSYEPNAMSGLQKIRHYLAKLWELFSENPREANTEGGLLPAIFGTVMLILLMAVCCFPLGVMTGGYLGEYAKEGVLLRLVHIAVNNLAGIPSIVYGIFGLSFFVYGIGGLLDQWFFPERVASGAPVWGTGGILWASLTLGLLTVPVVIVSTEEALRSIPRGLREGSYALGATKFQTLLRVLLPMASPGILTGFILAMARAAGEVAPLMITGVVKLAPRLPVDGRFPFCHLDRKFMHLGFHIYDIGFQSPNVEASKPMVFVTTLLLLLIVLSLSSLAVWLRNRMRRRFQIRAI